MDMPGSNELDWRAKRSIEFGTKLTAAQDELVAGVIYSDDQCDLLLHSVIGTLVTSIARIAELQGVDFADRRTLLALEKTVFGEIEKTVPRMLMEMVDAMKAGAADVAG